MDLHPDLSLEACLRAVQLVRTDGGLSQGAQAAAQAAGLKPGFGWLPWLASLPLIRDVAAASYALASRNRTRCETCP
jgi:hypothetical protein